MTQVLKVCHGQERPQSIDVSTQSPSENSQKDVDNPSFVEHFPRETIVFPWVFHIFLYVSPRAHLGLLEDPDVQPRRWGIRS